jgi:REP element-mobilizing transposase RayT
MPAHRPAILSHHLIWTLYGHWLAKDLHGSGSGDVRDPKFEVLGAGHHGRKPDRLQPSRGELKQFFKKAEPLLNFAQFWMDEAKRQAVASTIGEIVRTKPYTVWACAILSNHMHMVVRRHRDDAATIWRAIADVTRLRLRFFPVVEDNHPVWAARSYKVFLHTPHEIRTRIAYVQRNPAKENLPPQKFDFVKPYNNWPFHKPR